MDDKSQRRADRERLKALLRGAHLEAYRIRDVLYAIPIFGTSRSWEIRIGLCNNWVSWSTFVLRMPQGTSLRAALAERLLEINDIMSVAKFVKYEDSITLDMEYREERLDAETFENLTRLVYDFAEQYYPELHRLASGSEALSSLEEAFKRPALPGGFE